MACPSGLRSTPRKRVWVQAHRGFKSHRHRHRLGGIRAASARCAGAAERCASSERSPTSRPCVGTWPATFHPCAARPPTRPPESTRIGPGLAAQDKRGRRARSGGHSTRTRGPSQQAPAGRGRGRGGGPTDGVRLGVVAGWAVSLAAGRADREDDDAAGQDDEGQGQAGGARGVAGRERERPTARGVAAEAERVPAVVVCPCALIAMNSAPSTASAQTRPTLARARTTVSRSPRDLLVMPTSVVQMPPGAFGLSDICRPLVWSGRPASASVPTMADSRASASSTTARSPPSSSTARTPATPSTARPRRRSPTPSAPSTPTTAPAVAVLYGDGGTFCAGADLKAIGTERGQPGRRRTATGRWGRPGCGSASR